MNKHIKKTNHLKQFYIFPIHKHSIYDNSLKTSNFGLKPRKWLIFNCPDLKVGAIDMRDNQGFSHINEIY